MRRLLPLALAPAALAAVLAGCGGGSQSATTASGYTATKPAKTTTVKAARTKLGTVLVDGQGRTLYLFERDKGRTSTCYGACASAWPPVTGGATAAGLPAAKLASTKRTDGKAEVTYGGHPLYTYAGDAKPGDVQGQGLDQFGAEWYAVAPSGRKIDDDS